jgi:2-octaprenyl-6-methoxyphenol hydroxylase
MTTNSTHFDLVIAGGAMTGATLALMLARRFGDGLSIAVVEPYLAEHCDHPGFDARSIALSYGTVELLRQVDLWGELADVATPIQHISVTDQGHAGMTEIDAQDHQLSALGYVVELAEVGRIYTHLLKATASITLLSEHKIAKITRELDRVELSLDDGARLTTRLLVAADGAQSQCSREIGLQLEEHDFEQVALVTNIGLSQPHHGQAFERFTPSGPLALLPMSDNRMSLVWCVSPSRAEQLKILDDRAFLQQLQQQFGWRLGALDKVGARVTYPLLMRSRAQIISHRFAVVGNAAQTLHPIAGQGFNLGIRDAATLVDCLWDQRDAPSGDLGCYAGLDAYRQRRQSDRELTMNMTASMVHLFSNSYWPTTVGRNLGLMAMNHLPAMKAPLLKRTLGLVPR